MVEELVSTWHINHRVTLMVLDALPPEAMTATLSLRGGRDVARQFAHVHEVRTAWLRRGDILKGITHFKKGESPSKTQLTKALNESDGAVERLIRRACDAGGHVGGFRRDMVALLGYLIAHESHHRGSILLTAKQSGHALPESARWGIWAWDRI